LVRRERAQMNADNDALSERVESMLAAFDQQTRQLAGLKDRLVHIRAAGWSSNSLVRVTANASGIPIDVWIAPEAFKRSTPDRLAAAVAEAAQAAARAAQEQATTAIAPITETHETTFDISDLVPGAPNMREVFDSFIPAPAERVPEAVAPEEPIDAGRTARDAAQTDGYGDDAENSGNWLKDRW
jgi:DNA-binding protein YbaB